MPLKMATSTAGIAAQIGPDIPEFIVQLITTRHKNRGHTKIQLLLNRIYMTLIAQIQGKSDAVMAQTTVLAIGYFKH